LLLKKYASLYFQLVVTKTTARGFPTRLGRWQAGRAPSDDFWVDELVRKLRYAERQVSLSVNLASIRNK